MRLFLLISLVFYSFLSNARSVPVYMTPNSPAPTGHFHLQELKDSALAYDQFEWVWVRDSKGHDGWALKSSLMLPTDFSRRGVLSKGEEIYSSPKNMNLPQRTLKKSQVVSLLGRHRDWYQVLYTFNNKNHKGWVRSKYVRPYSKDPGYFFLTKETPLRKEPKIKTRFLGNVAPGIPLIPLKLLKKWALVRYGKKKGYIPLGLVRSRIDIAMKVRTPEGYYKPHPALIQKKIVEIFANPLWVGTGAFSIDLKSKPDMASNSVTTIQPWQSLTVQGYSIKKWGQSSFRRWGKVWWPAETVESNIELIENFKAKTTRLKKSEVYQVLKSPIVPGLRFASTINGIFRSFDGKNWHALPDFKHGYPIRLANGGAFFAGDKVSFDHGESFHDYIRWDKVLNSLPIEQKLGHGPVQILNVEPNKRNYKKVTLSLKLGSDRILQIYTPDLGQSWQVL